LLSSDDDDFDENEEDRQATIQENHEDNRIQGVE